jgi:hypothetical protein
MGSKSVYLSQEKAVHTEQIQSAIGQGLRREFDAAVGPLPNRLSDLVRKIDRSTNSNNNLF